MKKVLIIDDDRTVHSVLKLIFEKAGYRVFAALDAMQGMMMAKQVKPDLIVLDIMMPAGGGFSVYERLQVMADFIETPFLVYSTMDRAAILRKIPESRLVTVLNKSAKLEEITEAANRLTH